MTKYEKYKKQLREQAQRMLGADLERLKNLEKPHDVRFAYKVPTNADRIRAMSDEELGKFLGECKFCDICDEGCDNCTYHGDCDKRLLDWLKQPAEVE
jgi:hypothetical protein